MNCYNYSKKWSVEKEMNAHKKLELEMAKDSELELYPIIAQCLKAYFDELINQGFTEQQALHIVAIQGINAGRTN